MGVYYLDKEPREGMFAGFLYVALDFCDHGSLVVREEAQMGPQSNDLLALLKPYVFDISETSIWPGTELLGHTATVWKFHFNESVIQILCAVVPGLFQFRANWMPEDLALYRSNGTVWLSSVAHENLGWVELSDEELQSLDKSAPVFTGLLDDASVRVDGEDESPFEEREAALRSLLAAELKRFNNPSKPLEQLAGDLSMSIIDHFHVFARGD
jgi:hypothetical protein